MPDHQPADDAPLESEQAARPGLIHSYQNYDPKEFPSPTTPAPDLNSAAFEHMLAYGSMRNLTEEELARAVRLDPSMFKGLGPSIESLAAMLRERKRRILETFDLRPAHTQAHTDYRTTVSNTQPPVKDRDAFIRATNQEQISDLERLWYRQRDEQSDFARALMRVTTALANKYLLDTLSDKYKFTGNDPLSVEKALEVKTELEAIDELLEQLKQAAETAQLAIIDMEQLSEFADPQQIESLAEYQRQVEEFLRQAAKEQGLERSREGFSMTPKALRLFQRGILSTIFANLSESRSGRHSGNVVGEGATELQRTKQYQFGDSATNIDLPTSVANAAARAAREGHSPGFAPTRVNLDDLSIHLTRNNPRCATMVLMDMSGSMRHDGQYINCKRMALGLDGLIRGEYPGDFLGFIEMFTFGKQCSIGEVPALLPKPVSIHQPVVRLKADMSNPDITQAQIPQHFTNIQHSLSLARQVLRNQDTPNRQVMLITDGLPTAHFEGSNLFMLYPPDPRTEEATMREAHLCKRDQITVNIFLLPSWSQSSEDVQFAHRMAQSTGGRVFFTGGKDLDRFVLWDYVSNRRSIIG